MKASAILRRALALAGAAVVLQATAADTKEAPRATVEFPGLAEYTDVRDGTFDSEWGREHIAGQLTEHLVALARRLPAGQRLEVRFRDIDLAGDFEPWRGPHFDDVRIVKEIYPPRMVLTFRLLDASGAVLKEGERRLNGSGFLLSASGLRSDDPLRHDKDLLSDWFRREFRATR